MNEVSGVGVQNRMGLTVGVSLAHGRCFLAIFFSLLLSLCHSDPVNVEHFEHCTLEREKKKVMEGWESRLIIGAGEWPNVKVWFQTHAHLHAYMQKLWRTHTHTWTASLSKSYKTVTFLCRTPPSPPPLHSSSPPPAPIQLRPDGGACLSYRPLPAVVRIWDLGVSLSLSSPHTKKAGGQWFGMLHRHTHLTRAHAYTFILKNNSCIHDSTQRHIHAAGYHADTLAYIHGAHPDFMAASCVDVGGKIIIFKSEYEIFLGSFQMALSPFPSVISYSARLRNATCLWLLMTQPLSISPFSSLTPAP